MSTGKRALYCVVIILCSLLFFYYRHANLPYIDSKTDQYFDNITKKSISAYAVTRGINAIVSVIKESNLSISPAGLGISIAAGQILDPLDDMTEKLADVLVLSIVSLGIQKISMEIGQLLSLQVIAFLLPLLILPLWVKNGLINQLVSVAARIILILFILRFFLPSSMLINDFFYSEFMEENILETKEKLRVISESGGEISNFETITYDDGILDTLNSSLFNMTLKMEQMKRLFNKFKNNLGDIISSLLDLTIYYAMIFIIQVILIPLMILWITIKFVNYLFKSEIKSELLEKVGL